MHISTNINIEGVFVTELPFWATKPQAGLGGRLGFCGPEGEFSDENTLNVDFCGDVHVCTVGVLSSVTYSLTAVFNMSVIKSTIDPVN